MTEKERDKLKVLERQLEAKHVTQNSFLSMRSEDGTYEGLTPSHQAEHDERQFMIRGLASEIAELKEKRNKEDLNSPVVYTALDTMPQGGWDHTVPATARRNPGDDGGFVNVGEFMCALYRKLSGEGYDQRLQPLAVMDSTKGSTGGFALPPVFVDRIFAPDKALQKNPLLDNCDRFQMLGDKVDMPTWPDESHSSSAPYGLDWYQIPESGTFTESGTELGQLMLEAKKSGTLVHVSNEWLRGIQQIGLLNRLETIFRTSLRWYIEKLLWRGTGAGQALGCLAAPGTLEIAKQGSQAGGSATVVTENIVKMWSRLKTGHEANAIWVANKTVFPQLSTLTMNVGTGGANVSILNPETQSVSGAPSQGIFGRPLYFSEHLPAVGSSGDIVLLDPMMYVLGERQQVIVDVSPHFRFDKDQSTFRIQARFDGMPVLSSTFTPEYGDTTAWAVKIADR